MGKPSLILVGTNGSSISKARGQTSVALVLANTTFLFDVGLTTSLRLLEHKNLSAEEREFIYKEILNKINSGARAQGFIGTLELGQDLLEII